MNTAIARHLNIAESAIIRIEEWANVMFVVCKKLGARFVSKKVVQEEKKMELVAGENLLIGKTNLNRFSKLSSENILLPELSGSEKQVAWAIDIREKWLASFDNWIPEAVANIQRLAEKNRDAQKRFEEYVEDASRFVWAMSESTSARNFINLGAPNENLKVHEKDFKRIFQMSVNAGGRILEGEVWSDFYQV